MLTPVTYLGSHLLSACEARQDLLYSHIITILDEAGGLIGLRWPYHLNDQGAYSPAKTRKGVWTGNYWEFPSTESANSMLHVLQKKFPGVPVLDENKADPENGNAFAIMSVTAGVTALVLARKISYFTSIPGLINQEDLFVEGIYPLPSGHEHGPVSVYQVQEVTAGAGLSLVVILAAPGIIKRLADGIAAGGALETPALAHQFHTDSKIKIATSGWVVEIKIDPNDPRNWKLLNTNKMRSLDGGWVKVASTRRKWGSWKARIEEAGLEWEGDDPDAQDLSVPTNFDERRVAGWSTAAPNGHLLHAYQKTGAQFCAARGMRALLGDEMGVGKTVQAIAAAEATSAPRIVIICPANARYVWQREIQGWGGVGSIQHVSSQLDTLDLNARWHILTYDLIATRAETWRLMDEVEVKAFIKACPELATAREVTRGAYPRKVSLDKPLDGVPDFADPKRLKAWEKMMQRLRGELLEQILSAGQMLVILDEAHRVKNRGAKRTKAIQRIAAGDAQVLMLTGTPLRNNQHEAAVLLGLLDASAANALNSKNGYGIQDVKDYLSYFMLRRTKAEVLPELPEKTRQRIDLDKLDPDSLEQYHNALDMAQQLYLNALERGTSENEARQAMQGGIEKARTALGIAKVLGGGVVDVVRDVMENKGCCVVFCAHHSVSDALKAQLERENLKVAIIDGRVAPKARATIVAEFQAGQLDVVIGGINAAGEAITLTRADTVIFVELDWVPAALLQAEDRIHRVGQKGNCQVIQLVARMDGENLDEMMVGLLSKKMEVIGAVLGEDTSSVVASSIKADLHNILLKKDKANDSALHQTHQEQEPKTAIETVDAATTNLMQAASSQESKPKPRRGRPKVYVNAPPPSSTERSKQSINALVAAGGKRVMLRLSAEAHEALRVIMAITGGTQETATINQALVARKIELLRASTQK
jgi:hypothetical protein